MDITAALEYRPIGDLVDTTMAPRITTKKPPCGENKTSEYAQLIDGLD